MAIYFFNEDITFKLSRKNHIKRWLQDIAAYRGFVIRDLNFIFCSDNYILSINRQYLNHDYFTDVITFDNSVRYGFIEGDVYISLDSVKSSADEFHTDVIAEIYRVLSHSVLHLIGFNDKTANQKKLMRSLENHFITQIL
jgi:probable rRNA maturation factor